MPTAWRGSPSPVNIAVVAGEEEGGARGGGGEAAAPVACAVAVRLHAGRVVVEQLWRRGAGAGWRR